MEADLVKILVSGLGGLTTVAVAAIKYRTSLKKREATILKAISEKDGIPHQVQTEILKTLQEVDNTLKIVFRCKVNESRQEIMELKKLAWNRQQDELYNGLKRIIRANGLPDKADRLRDIKDLIRTVITDADETLQKFNLNNYMAPTAKKIKFVCGGEAPGVLYNIITNEAYKKDYQKLEDNIRKYGQHILNSVKAEFYRDSGRVKE